MTVQIVQSFAEGRWHAPAGTLQEIRSAVSGKVVAQTSSAGLDFGAMARHARLAGGKVLREMTFHQRAAMLKALAQAVLARKEELYELSFATGATRNDSWIDIEGGAGTMLSFASKGRRDLPDDRLLIDGETEVLGKGGSFVGQHVYTSLQGVAVLINAYNFPVWGMLEKLAPCLLAGVPAIVKPAQQTGYVAEAAFRVMVESGALPAGVLQLVSGSTGDLLDHMTGQDVVAFTGSARTAQKLQNHPVIAREAVRFTAERDSLNAAVLGPDASEGTPEFDLFVKEGRQGDDREGRTEMHRDPARVRPGRTDGCRAGCLGRKARQGGCRGPPPGGGPDGRAGERGPARRCPSARCGPVGPCFGRVRKPRPRRPCRRRPRARRFHVARPVAERRALGQRGAARGRGVRARCHPDALQGCGRRGGPRQSRDGQPGHVGLHPRCRHGVGIRARGRLPPWPHGVHRPRLRQGVHRAWFAAARPDAWRPGPRGRGARSWAAYAA